MNVNLPSWERCPLTSDGRQDMNGDIVSLFSRIWPGTWQANGKISSHVAIYAMGEMIATAEFEADTEEGVKLLTESWARLKIADLLNHLHTTFPPIR